MPAAHFPSRTRARTHTPTFWTRTARSQRSTHKRQTRCEFPTPYSSGQACSAVPLLPFTAPCPPARASVQPVTFCVRALSLRHLSLFSTTLSSSSLPPSSLWCTFARRHLCSSARSLLSVSLSRISITNLVSRSCSSASHQSRRTARANIESGIARSTLNRLPRPRHPRVAANRPCHTAFLGLDLLPLDPELQHLLIILGNHHQFDSQSPRQALQICRPSSVWSSVTVPSVRRVSLSLIQPMPSR